MRANFNFRFKNSWATTRPKQPLAPMRRTDWEDMLDPQVGYGFVSRGSELKIMFMAHPENAMSLYEDSLNPETASKK